MLYVPDLELPAESRASMNRLQGSRGGRPHRIQELVTVWREYGEILERLGDSRGAHICRLVADDIAAALLEAGEQLLNLEQAAAHSGYSKRR